MWWHPGTVTQPEYPDQQPPALLVVGAQALRSAAFYPTTMLYAGTVVVLAGVVHGWLNFMSAIIILALAAALAVTVSTRREIIAREALLMHQHHQLLAQIDFLLGVLDAEGVHVPDPRPEAKHAERPSG